MLLGTEVTLPRETNRLAMGFCIVSTRKRDDQFIKEFGISENRKTKVKILIFIWSGNWKYETNIP